MRYVQFLLFGFLIFSGIRVVAQDSVALKALLTGKIDYAKDDRFVLVDQSVCNKPTWLRKEAAEAFYKMAEAAAKDGISLTIISGARSFWRQKQIWERKWQQYSNLPPEERASKILNFSAMPMTSRHHWGTEVDLNQLNNDYFSRGEGARIYQWLCDNAPDFGFCQVYTNTGLITVPHYAEEKWHWSYMPVSFKMLYLYDEWITDEDITGFSGSELAGKLKVIDYYVNGVDESCTPPDQEVPDSDGGPYGL